MTRTTTVTVRLTPDEHDLILQRAIDNYESVSEYLRRLALTEAAEAAEAAEREATP